MPLKTKHTSLAPFTKWKMQQGYQLCFYHYTPPTFTRGFCRGLSEYRSIKRTHTCELWLCWCPSEYRGITGLVNTAIPWTRQSVAIVIIQVHELNLLKHDVCLIRSKDLFTSIPPSKCWADKKRSCQPEVGPHEPSACQPTIQEFLC